MRYSLRTLMILMLLGGPALAVVWWAREWLLPVLMIFPFFVLPLWLLLLQSTRNTPNRLLVVVLLLWLACFLVCILLPAVQ